MISMRQAKLSRLVALWQKRLRVTDWEVRVIAGKEAAMSGDLGSTLYDPRHMCAELTIAIDMSDPAYADGGIEQTVIHELLHLVLHGDQEYEKEHIMQERAINQIADALYRAYRKR